MTDALSAIHQEQRRVSDELSAMRSMHMELMKSVSELCGKMDILTTVQSELRSHRDDINALKLTQASNQFFIDQIKNINRAVMIAALSAVGSGGLAVYMALKGGVL